MKTDDDRLLRLAERLGHRFADPDLLARALRHGSAASAQAAGSYQRLEFLGDAVLGHAVAELLYEAMPDADQGRLSQARTSLVRSQALAEKGAALGLADFVELGCSEESERGRNRTALLEDVFEAVVAALAIDGGWSVARAFVRRQFAEDAAALADLGAAAKLVVDSKGALLARAHAENKPEPEFVQLADRGDGSPIRFVFEVCWAGMPLGRGEGATKRAAQQEAARRALARLGSTEGKAKAKRR